MDEIEINSKEIILHNALQDKVWIGHTIGDMYNMINVNGSQDTGWKIAYYPLFGTYKDGAWVEFKEPRALIEKPLSNGIDFREVPLRYLRRQPRSVVLPSKTPPSFE